MYNDLAISTMAGISRIKSRFAFKITFDLNVASVQITIVFERLDFAETQ